MTAEYWRDWLRNLPGDLWCAIRSPQWSDAVVAQETLESARCRAWLRGLRCEPVYRESSPSLALACVWIDWRQRWRERFVQKEWPMADQLDRHGITEPRPAWAHNGNTEEPTP